MLNKKSQGGGGSTAHRYSELACGATVCLCFVGAVGFYLPSKDLCNESCFEARERVSQRGASITPAPLYLEAIYEVYYGLIFERARWGRLSVYTAGCYHLLFSTWVVSCL